MSIEDAEHYSAEECARITASYPPHERDARTQGVPALGSGRVFPIAQEEISVAPFAIPAQWALIGGMDFGYDHPFAAVKLAWDRDADILYVVCAYRKREATPIIHAAALKPWALPCRGRGHMMAYNTTKAAATNSPNNTANKA